MAVQLLLHITLFLSSMTIAILAVPPEAPLAKPNCQSHCGDIQIPYPFGIGASCYIEDWFQVLCDNSTGSPRALLNRTNLEVLDISVEGTIKVTNPITFSANCSNKKPIRSQSANLGGTPFLFSQKNIFTAMGCGVMAMITSKSNGSTISSGCKSQCDISSNTCNGVHCCHTAIPYVLSAFNTSFQFYDDHDSTKPSSCNYAFLADPDWFRRFADNNSANTTVSAISDMGSVPVMLDWNLYHSKVEVFGDFEVENGYNGPHVIFDSSFYCLSYNHSSSSSRLECSCKWGYAGNPYLLQGCHDIDECEVPNKHCRADSVRKNRVGYYECHSHGKSRVELVFIGVGSGLGLLFLVIGVWWLHKVITIKLKEKLFAQNGGLFLELQSLSSGEDQVGGFESLLEVSSIQKN